MLQVFSCVLEIELVRVSLGCRSKGKKDVPYEKWELALELLQQN